MIKKFKSLNITEKIILFITTITYIIITTRLFLNSNTLTTGLESLISFLILMLWLVLVNNFKCVEKWFSKNELRILITIFCGIIVLYFNSEMLISKSFTNQIAKLMESFLISSIFIEINSKNLIDSNDAVICMISLFLVPTLIKSNTLPFIVFLLIIYSVYVLTGVIIQGIKDTKLKKDFIVDVLGLIIAIISIIINII